MVCDGGVSTTEEARHVDGNIKYTYSAEMPRQEEPIPHPSDTRAERRRIALASLAPISTSDPTSDERYPHANTGSGQYDKDGTDV